MKKRQVFRPNIVLLVEGRLLLLILLGFPIYLACETCYSSIYLKLVNNIPIDKTNILGFFILEIMLFSAAAFLCHWLWQLCFGKLIITDEYIQWRCLFCKKITLPVEEIFYVKAISFTDGNYLKDYKIYNSNFEYALLSSEPLPNKRIDKIRCKDNLIRFMLTPDLCEALGEALPERGGVFRTLAIKLKAKKRKK